MTAANIDADGWLRVGDIAILRPNGSIELVDRLHEMRKLQNGQFIAPSKLENIYINAPLINQIYIDVNSNYQFLVAVVSCVEERLLQYADVNGIHGDFKQLIKSPDVEYGVLKQLERLAHLKGLSTIEKITRVHIVEEPFSTKNGLLSGT